MKTNVIMIKTKHTQTYICTLLSPFSMNCIENTHLVTFAMIVNNKPIKAYTRTNVFLENVVNLGNRRNARRWPSRPQNS